tara:strand:+ start:154 stop:1518 length:1365 start_codon:yes stop_codon:yes gene_type:complete
MKSPLETKNIQKTLTVSELNHTAKELLENTLSVLWISGEISNLNKHISGHWYFSLKDDNAQIRCVFFRYKNRLLDWKPEDGMKVEVQALVTLFEIRGDFQLNIDTMRLAGKGNLFQAFELLKIKLEKEGLFESKRKKPLPTFPKQIGIITSSSGAALRDVLSTLKHRMPSIPIIIYPTQVQGDGASEKIVNSIQIAEKRNECDALILCRGGGSIEDLWSFNEEIVARAIVSCPIPIICGIGHETDFTIADFVSDARAPTPTGAANHISPDKKELLQKIESINKNILRIIQNLLDIHTQHIDMLSHRLIHPNEQIHSQFIYLKQLNDKFKNIWPRYFENRLWSLRELNQRIKLTKPDTNPLLVKLKELDNRLSRSITYNFEKLMASLERKQSHLNLLNPASILDRGYSITYDKDKKILRQNDQINIGDTIKITFAKGWSKAKILKKGKKETNSGI